MKVIDPEVDRPYPYVTVYVKHHVFNLLVFVIPKDGNYRICPSCALFIEEVAIVEYVDLRGYSAPQTAIEIYVLCRC